MKLIWHEFIGPTSTRDRFRWHLTNTLIANTDKSVFLQTNEMMSNVNVRESISKF